MNACPCNFDGAGHRLFSPAWYVAHEAHHLAVFPNVDERTRANLAESSVRAAALGGAA